MHFVEIKSFIYSLMNIFQFCIAEILFYATFITFHGDIASFTENKIAYQQKSFGQWSYRSDNKTIRIPDPMDKIRI